jgi:hypothetical protein
MADIPAASSDKTAKPDGQNARQVQPTTAEDITNRETVEKLTVHIWAAVVAKKILSEVSGLADELIQSHLLDDDEEDEEADEDWLDNHHKREKKSLDEAIADGLDTYPDINSINNSIDGLIDNLSLPGSDPDIRAAAGQLKNVLARCPIGVTKLKERFSRPQLERMVRIELEKQFKNDPKYSEHIRADVPGKDIRKYGSKRATSSAGTFYKSTNYLDGAG